jgi:hypothetical protein
MRLCHARPRHLLAISLIGTAAACSLPGQAPMATPAGTLHTQQFQQIIQTSQGGTSQGISQVSGPGYSYSNVYGPGYSYSSGPGYSYSNGPSYSYSYGPDYSYGPGYYSGNMYGNTWLDRQAPYYSRTYYSSGPGYTSSYSYGPGQASQSSQQTMVLGGY